MRRLTFKIALLSSFYGGEDKEVTGYALTPNFACHKSDLRGGSWVLTHLPSGRTVFWRPTRAACLADAVKLEAATTPDGKRFHWETVTRDNAERRMRRLGAKGMSRILGRDVSLRSVS